MICVGNDSVDAVEVYRLLEVLIVPRYPVICSEYILVSGGDGVPNARVEDCWIVGAAAVQYVVFCDPSHFFLGDDKRKAAGIPAVSADFSARCDHCDRSDKFVDWPVLSRSCDSWERVRIEADFVHCIDGGGTRFCHGKRVVGLRHALKDFVTTDSHLAYIDDLKTWLRNYVSYS